MATYEELAREADVLVANRYQPYEAVLLYKEALAMAGNHEERLRCLRYIGVCYQLLRRWQDSLKWHQRALQVAENDLERANVLIDMAQANRGLGWYGEASQNINQALVLLNPEENRDRFAVAKQFLGQLESEQGRHKDAIDNLLFAVVELQETGAKADELYAMLRLSIAYAAARQWVKSRIIAWYALKLTRYVGSRAHQLRALLLLTGGNTLRQLVEQPLRRLIGR